LFVQYLENEVWGYVSRVRSGLWLLSIITAEAAYQQPSADAWISQTRLSLMRSVTAVSGMVKSQHISCALLMDVNQREYIGMTTNLVPTQCYTNPRGVSNGQYVLSFL